MLSLLRAQLRRLGGGLLPVRVVSSRRVLRERGRGGGRGVGLKGLRVQGRLEGIKETREKEVGYGFIRELKNRIKGEINNENLKLS